MLWLPLFFMAILQGLTEFLPVSSSGHLAAFSILYELKQPPVLTALILHIGTLFSVLIAFKQELASLIAGLFQGHKASVIYACKIVVTTTVTGVIGLSFKGFFKGAYDNLYTISFCWLITAALLYFTDKKKEGSREVTWAFSVIVGIAQAAAIMPGISRSGATVICCLLLGISRPNAISYSFLISIPAILGASVLEAKDLSQSEIQSFSENALIYLASVFIAAVVGYYAIALLKKMVVKGQLKYFGYYLVVLSIACLSYLTFQ